MIKKLLIAIPCYDTMRAEFVQSLTALMGRLTRDNVPYEVKILSGTLVYMARDALARHAVNNGCSHVLWLDCDMVFQESILDDLTISGEKDMVCGLFLSRHNPYLLTIFSSMHPSVDRVQKVKDDVFRIAACGFACVLMKAQILRDVMNGNSGKCFLPTALMSEDLAFCERATACGYTIWCEPTARVGHVGAVTIWPEDGERLRGEIQNTTGKELN